ncbi:hypothetical protein D3C85_1125460 [compost metagenome]
MICDNGVEKIIVLSVVWLATDAQILSLLTEMSSSNNGFQFNRKIVSYNSYAYFICVSVAKFLLNRF